MTDFIDFLLLSGAPEPRHLVRRLPRQPARVRLPAAVLPAAVPAADGAGGVRGGAGAGAGAAPRSHRPLQRVQLAAQLPDHAGEAETN